MRKPYIILVNGTLAARHVTRLGALRQIQALNAKGIKGVLAYELIAGDRSIVEAI